MERSLGQSDQRAQAVAEALAWARAEVERFMRCEPDAKPYAKHLLVLLSLIPR